MRSNNCSRTVLIASFALLSPLFLLGSCKEANRQNASDTRDQPTRQVRVSIVRRGEILSSLTFTGTLEPFQEVKVTSKIPGRVEK
ncbi:MAG: efflux RND transporter periplasmic adaptor subunit, partial [Dehalococcoidia bacterium]|nr:efflux RND transporter periplasmic adaptor subunit [Dehalococcoidia bacterium]